MLSGGCWCANIKDVVWLRQLELDHRPMCCWSIDTFDKHQFTSTNHLILVTKPLFSGRLDEKVNNKSLTGFP